MSRATLILAIHNHQPVGNFDHIFAKAFRECYAPFIETLADYPEVRIALHYSGCLLEWIEDHEPAHVDMLKKLVERGQVEILGGGYYEPILSAIPEHDALLQIQTYAEHLENVFGKRPSGIWLPERVWDPCLPRLLSRAGVLYSLVDDSHFIYAGLPQNQIWGRFITEREGHAVSLFPIDMKLRYWIPFREPGESIAYLKARSKDSPEFAAVYGDDGEKFGVWPGTREWVYEKGWLRSFFQALTENREWLRIITLSEYLASAPPRGRVYIPPASYEEMMIWALPPKLSSRLERFILELKEENRMEELAPLVRGAAWDNFLIRYPEANLMHKRMIRVSEKIKRAEEEEGIQDIEEARKCLFRGQCNCAYWHGVFGGIYLNYLRHAVYENLIEADVMIEKKRNPGTWLSMERADFDRDGQEEILLDTDKLGAYIHPAKGGTLFYLEYKPARFCLSNVLSRSHEAYHEKIQNACAGEIGRPLSIHERLASKEANLEQYLVYDRFPRYSFLDHFVTGPIRIEDLIREDYTERGHFASGAFQVKEDMAGRRFAMITLARQATVDLDYGDLLLEMRKSFAFESRWSGLGVEYELINLSQKKLVCDFAVECNFTLLAGDSEDRYYRINGEKPEESLMRSIGRHDAVYEMALVDEAVGFHIEMFFKPEARALFRFPLETVSRSEAGFERTYQGSVIWATHPLEIGPGEKWQWQIVLNMEKGR